MTHYHSGLTADDANMILYCRYHSSENLGLALLGHDGSYRGNVAYDSAACQQSFIIAK